MNRDYQDFCEDFNNFIKTQDGKNAIVNTLSNIFSMRKIGNKTHGDLAEIGMTEFINQFLGDKYECRHVGKDLFRAKEHEEDILIKNKISQVEFGVSLKAYGNGPLQLSTDKESVLFPYLEKLRRQSGTGIITNSRIIRDIFADPSFDAIFTRGNVNVLPLIYNENEQKCNIMSFLFEKAKNATAKIVFVDAGMKFKKGQVQEGKGRKHPLYLFLDKNDQYIFEVRYGDQSANALQRGLWTHTGSAKEYFSSLTDGWIQYKINDDLVDLLALELNAPVDEHRKTKQTLLAYFSGMNKEN